jgi:hypothetical protein
MNTYIALDQGLKAFILALINDEVIPADENVLVSKLQHSGKNFAPKDLHTIIDFATGCGYLEKLGSQLVFTKSGRDKANSYRRENNRPAAQQDAGDEDRFVVPKGI